jgi:chromosomal replication initiation ATPase DnaA
VTLIHVPAHARTVAEPAYPTIRDIQDAVCAAFGVTRLDLLSHRRQAHLAGARQVAMWLARWHTPFSYPEIGRRFDKRDHTTIIHGVSRVAQRMADDPAFAGRVRALARSLDDGDGCGAAASSVGDAVSVELPT